MARAKQGRLLTCDSFCSPSPHDAGRPHKALWRRVCSVAAFFIQAKVFASADDA